MSTFTATTLSVLWIRRGDQRREQQMRDGDRHQLRVVVFGPLAAVRMTGAASRSSVMTFLS